MTEPTGQDHLEVPELLDPTDAGLPAPDHRSHAKMPELDDDQLAIIAESERAATGLAADGTATRPQV